MARFSSTVIDHFTNPRNCARLPDADASAFVGNPVCGDQILLTARVHDDVVREIGFEAFALDRREGGEVAVDARFA